MRPAASRETPTRRAYRGDFAVFAEWSGLHGLDPLYTTPEHVAAFLAAEIERWGRVVRDNQIQADLSGAPG